jgi:alkanesulfonate monooxygenase SsuD/methylene tetrahydromethanopterin reductase-like flavin-dependent oxidoreductase (luciferase family)/iron-sulfur cluster repair protein YtfE (RIC family)
MTDYGQDLRFGVFLTPDAADPSAIVENARLADVAGIDLVTVQDHPYLGRFLDAWTLLSVIAGQTSTVRLAPNVANLPLRPPAVLARSVASLDLLSGGRAELGLGSGAFWDGIVAMGGTRLRPGEAVDALAEAIAIIRALWDPAGPVVRHDGPHYRVVGAQRGPAPAHPVEIWVGSYKPRMLRLTGSVADGWLPSMGYLDPEGLAEANAIIDEAAAAAGREPAGVRRLYNINGRFGTGSGFLAGSPADWAEQLAGLTLDEGMSTYILAGDDPDAIRIFAAEVAPAVRDLVATERGMLAGAGTADRNGGRGEVTRPGGPPVAYPAAAHAAGAFTVVPTADNGERRSTERLWDESTRPVGPAPDPDLRYTAEQQATGRHLIDVHDALRAELEQLHDVIGQVQRGIIDAGRARSLINTMTMRQNTWTLGAFCESYCRIVTGHHSLEDRSVFPHLRRRDQRLAPVLDRLAEEHEAIAEVLDRVDRALVAMVTRPDGMAQLAGAVDLLDDVLLSHLSYEERELVEPLARLGFY